MQVLGVDFAFDVTRLLVVGVLAAARVLPIFTLAPFFGGRLVPPLIRIAVSLAFVAVLFPGIDAATPDLSALGPVTLGALLFKEVAVGLVLGFLASIPFWAVEAAGRLADTARGANMAEVLEERSRGESAAHRAELSACPARAQAPGYQPVDIAGPIRGVDIDHAGQEDSAESRPRRSEQ